MIGSPDVLVLTGAEGFGAAEEEQEAPGVPEELSVPLFPASHPWSSAARFHRDFILVAEFCERVGPKPVLTIPDDQKVIDTFDLNHFSVRIMSVDYQASGPGPAAHSSPGLQLNFSEDSKVILGDSAEDAFAYVHHMTLYDLEARGMVRPFCMAYVCSDQAKLMENLWELSTCFSQASESLKTGNRQAFSLELQRKLQQLEFKRLALLQQTANCQKATEDLSEEEQTTSELETIEHSILSHRDLLRQVTSYPNRKLKQPDFLPYDTADPLTDPNALLSLEPGSPTTTFTSAPLQTEDGLKSLEQLCNTYFLSLMKGQLADAERRLRGDRSILRTTHVIHSLSRRLTLTNFLFELWSPENVEEDENEKEVELQATSEKMRGPLERQTGSPVMESFFSCVEEIPIKLEAGEDETRSSELEAEMTGSVSSGDSIEVLGTEKSYRTQHAITGPDVREASFGMSDAHMRRAPVDSGVRRVRAYAKRANSEDSIEVLSTTESIFPDDLKAITEEEAEHFRNGSEPDEEPQADCKSEPDEEKSLDEDQLENKDDDDEGATEEDQDEISKHRDIKVFEEHEVMKTKDDPGSPSKLMQVEVAGKSKLVPQMVRSVPDLLVTFAPPLPLIEEDQWTPPRPNMRLLSIDEGSDCTSFTSYTSATSSSDSSSHPQNTHVDTHDRSVRNRRRKAGLRALRFIKQNSFAQHAVFCLLSGRPLVVIGGDETLVRKLVDALSLFLPAPGPDRGAVMPCLTTPLQLTDLLTWKLIGIHRSSSNSSSTILHSLMRYSRYLALLDLDQRTLRSPSYSGSLLGSLVNPQSLIGRGITYLLHVESCLTALANQVLLYTFAPAAEGAAREDGAKEEDASSTQSLCDQRVMHFLSDLVKQRYAGHGPPVLNFSYSPVHLHRNTFIT